MYYKIRKRPPQKVRNSFKLWTRQKSMKALTIRIMLGLLTVGLLISIPSSFAYTQTPTTTTTIIPIDSEISLEKTVTIMSVPKDNTLPWGSVKGKIADPVERYPVIIQFFKGEDAVHFAQVDVKGDGSYEYKFRVRSVDGDNVINIFEGDYSVSIFKVVHSNLDTI